MKIKIDVVAVFCKQEFIAIVCVPATGEKKSSPKAALFYFTNL